MTSPSFEFRRADRLAGETTNVWSVFTPLAVATKAVNLGQGFPSFPVPQYMKDAVASAVSVDMNNQYSRSPGMPLLCNAVAEAYSKQIGRKLDPMTEVLITQGATEGTLVSFLAFINPGDEVIVIEPFYDMYPANIGYAGGVPVYVPLRFRDVPGAEASSTQWYIDMDELERAVTPRTRAILFNSPHDPMGKVFSRAELEEIRAFVLRHNLIVVSDEVYNRLVYDAEHISIASLPDMFERTFTVFSAGKTFPLTGWKIGWVLGPALLISTAALAHSRVAFCATTPLQAAVAACLSAESTQNFGDFQRSLLKRNRDRLVAVLQELGLRPIVPQGAYFVLFDTSRIPYDGPGPLDSDVDEATKAAATAEKAALSPLLYNGPRDWQVCRWLTESAGVAAIPPSAFYSKESIAKGTVPLNLARLCYCKDDATMDKAIERLRAIAPFLKEQQQ